MMTLDKGKVGKTLMIDSFLGDIDKTNQRLLELGFTQGQRVRIVAKSAMKKAVLLEIRGYLLSIRTSMLANVVVK